MNKLKSTVQRGFTMVELIVVVAITTIGFVALLNLQIGTIHGSANARDMQTALSLADHVAQTMRIEALQWITAHPNGNTSFKFINNAPVTTTPGTTNDKWLIGYKPGTVGTTSDLRVGSVGSEAAYDAGALAEIGNDTNAHFCVHYRFTWLVDGVLLRADIRVMWMRNRGDFGSYRLCPLGMENDLHNIRSVTIPATIMRNVFVRTS